MKLLKLTLISLFIFALVSISVSAVFANPVTAFVDGCEKELSTYCAEVPAGEGRLAECLNRNKTKPSEGSNQAMKDVGL